MGRGRPKCQLDRFCWIVIYLWRERDLCSSSKKPNQRGRKTPVIETKKPPHLGKSIAHNLCLFAGPLPLQRCSLDSDWKWGDTTGTAEKTYYFKLAAWLRMYAWGHACFHLLLQLLSGNANTALTLRASGCPYVQASLADAIDRDTLSPVQPQQHAGTPPECELNVQH